MFSVRYTYGLFGDIGGMAALLGLGDLLVGFTSVRLKNRINPIGYRI